MFTAGYSEGAAYSVWFSKCLDTKLPCKCDEIPDIKLNSQYELAKSAGLEGVYDLFSVQFPFLTDNVGDYSVYRILDQK